MKSICRIDKEERIKALEVVVGVLDKVTKLKDIKMDRDSVRLLIEVVVSTSIAAADIIINCHLGMCANAVVNQVITLKSVQQTMIHISMLTRPKVFQSQRDPTFSLSLRNFSRKEAQSMHHS